MSNPEYQIASFSATDAKNNKPPKIVGNAASVYGGCDCECIITTYTGGRNIISGFNFIGKMKTQDCKQKCRLDRYVAYRCYGYSVYLTAP